MKRFRRNPRLDEQLRAMPGFARAIAMAVEHAREHAERFANAAQSPWMPRRGTGTNRTVVIDTSGDRPRIVNTDHAGHLVEWGSANNPPHAPLRRGARAAGLRLEQNT